MISGYKWLRLSCAGCDAQLRVDVAHAGKQVSCPSCNAVRDIPSEDQLTRLLAHRETTAAMDLDNILPAADAGAPEHARAAM